MISGSDRICVLALSGSLRAASTNTSLLLAVSLLALANTQVEHYSDIGRLMMFFGEDATKVARGLQNPKQIHGWIV